MLNYEKCGQYGCSYCDPDNSPEGKVQIELGVLRTQREELLKALQAIIPHIEEYIKDIGGCDHAVGICCCHLIRDAEQASAVIARAQAVQS